MRFTFISERSSEPDVVFANMQCASGNGNGKQKDP